MYGYGFSTSFGMSSGTPPVNTVAPAITGTAEVGQTLTCSQGTWTGTAPITYAYQWKRDGSNIGSATNSTYTLVSADGGTTVSCTVTATNGVGSASANATGVAVPVPWSNTYSFLFDGVNERIDIGTTSLGITGAISVSAWVKTTASGLIKSIICEDETGSNRNWLLLMTNLNKAGFVVWHTNGTLSDVYSTASINDGNWHHVLGTYDGTSGANKLKLYVDGVLHQATANSTGVKSNTNTEACIGALSGGVDWYWNGNIDEVAVFNTNQSSNASTIYNSGTPTDLSSLSPLAYYRMGDGDTWGGSNWTLIDNGSAGRNGTSVNMEQADRVTTIP